MFNTWRTVYNKNQMLKWNDRFYLMIVVSYIRDQSPMLCYVHCNETDKLLSLFEERNSLVVLKTSASQLAPGTIGTYSDI